MVQSIDGKCTLHRRRNAPHRRAFEEVIGQQLAVNQRLFINVMEVSLPAEPESRPPQTLADWTKVYDGLTEDEIKTVDQIVNTRANLTRDLP